MSDTNNKYRPGDWLAVCDICGFRFFASELTKNWKNEYVCKSDLELRHPQEFIRVRPERIGVPWARPEGADIYLPVCYLWERSAYAGLGTAGCMMAGYTPSPYSYLLNLKNGT